MIEGGLFTESAPLVGEVTINRGELVIDADPYVMQRVRGLFPGSVSGGAGTRTHRVVTLAPWSGVPTFEIDGVPVSVVDPKKASL